VKDFWPILILVVANAPCSGPHWPQGADSWQIFFILFPVLPGPDVASPPTQQKSTAIWRKFDAISNFSKIPLLFRYFWSFRIDLPIK
jgi:hypothetical protein